MSDAAEAVGRLFGRQSNRSNATPYENPQQMVDALRNPFTEEDAVARMHKMHYGAFYNEKNRGMFSGLAENELLTKGKGFGGYLFGRPMKGISVAHSHLSSGLPFAAAQGIFEASRAPKHHKMSALIGGTAKAIAFGLGDAIGTVLAGPVAGIILGSITERLGGAVEEGVQFFNDFNRMSHHINMGGNYEDTRMAYTMRQRASQEMGSSVMNARRYLGSEGILMHQ